MLIARYPNASTSPGTARGSMHSASMTCRPGTSLRTISTAAASPTPAATRVASEA
jgi:hypothetical protein